LPVIGAWFLLIFLIIAFRWKDTGFLRLIYALCIGLAITAYAAYISGGQAEHQLKLIAGPSFQAIHENIELHEGAAAWTWLAFLASGILAAIGLFRQAASRWLIPVLFVLSLALVALSSWTGLLGGLIAHTEIRNEPVSQFAEQIHLPRIHLGGKRKRPAAHKDPD
jgi:hypothetical protein